MPERKNLPALHVACVAERGSFDEAMPRGFARLFTWLKERGVQPAGKSMAVFYDDPAKVPPEAQRLDTCVPVDANVEGLGDVSTKMIGGFEVAALVYRGRGDRDQAYHDLYDWLHSEGYHESGPPIETYLSQLGEEMRAEIAVPIEMVSSGGRKTTKRASGTTTKRTTNKRTKTNKSQRQSPLCKSPSSRRLPL
jgi:DNA gyrase inhibitor GyrI